MTPVCTHAAHLPASLSVHMGDHKPVPADISSVFQIMTSNTKLNEGKMYVHPVELTLEEVYHGCLKKVTFQRRKLLPDETVETENRQLIIDVKPGLPDGTRFVFEGFESAQNVISLICVQHNTGHSPHVPTLCCLFHKATRLLFPRFSSVTVQRATRFHML